MERLQARLVEAYEAREQEFGPQLMREIERHFLLQIIDLKWMEHLRAMDELREGIGLRAYGQRNPLLEYQFEAYEMFQGDDECDSRRCGQGAVPRAGAK